MLSANNLPHQYPDVEHAIDATGSSILKHRPVTPVMNMINRGDRGSGQSCR